VTRVLFVVPPLTGHVNPTISVARELARAGHEVAWAAHGDVVGPLLPLGARLFSVGEARGAEFFRPQLERSAQVRGLESLQFLWETLLVPLARAMRPAVAAAIAEIRPDVLVVDQQALGGALAARASGLPWATFATTSAGVTDPLAGLPKVKQWVAGQMAALEDDAGLPHVDAPDLSPHRVVVFSTDALVGPLAAFPAHYRFVGPSISDRPDATPFPWEALAPAPTRRVLVSLGTVSAERGGDFYQTCATALAGGPWQVILVAPDGRVPAPPDNFIVRPRVPQLALLPHVHAVVCHAGHNTVCESLAHGLPLVVAPIRDDQPVIADQVVRAGAGVRVRFGRLSPGALREAVARVLDDPAPRAAAARVRASFAAAGGAPAAAALITELAA
jgi:MGT family glycosyltransferase